MLGRRLHALSLTYNLYTIKYIGEFCFLWFMLSFHVIYDFCDLKNIKKHDHYPKNTSLLDNDDDDLYILILVYRGANLIFQRDLDSFFLDTSRWCYDIHHRNDISQDCATTIWAAARHLHHLPFRHSISINTNGYGESSRTIHTTVRATMLVYWLPSYFRCAYVFP